MRRVRRMQAFLDDPAADPLLYDSPLRRRGIAPAVAVALVCVLGLALSQVIVLVVRTGRVAGAPWVFAQALFYSSLLSVVPLAVVWFLDRRERESRWPYVGAFLWGGLVATGLALPANQAILAAIADWLASQPMLQAYLGGKGAALLLGAPIAGPLVEETTKGLALVLLFVLLRTEFDDLRDGLVYGALVGAGFNWLESAVYVTNGFAQTGVAPWGGQLGGRYALFGLAGHVLYTGLFGAGLGLARQTSRRWVRLVAPPLGLLLAILCHAFNNALALIVVVVLRAADQPLPDLNAPPAPVSFLEAWVRSSQTTLILFLPALLLASLALWRSGVWERRVIRDELRDEVGAGETVTAAEYAGVERDGVLRTRRLSGSSRAERRLSAALVLAQNELAFRKHRVRSQGGDPAADRLVHRWRTAIADLRRQQTGPDGQGR